jgi:hypothetical protein
MDVYFVNMLTIFFLMWPLSILNSQCGPYDMPVLRNTSCSNVADIWLTDDDHVSGVRLQTVATIVHPPGNILA